MTRTPDYGVGDRRDALHRSFTAMRNALRSIVFHNGDCMRFDEPDRAEPCECAVCIAKGALQGEEEWRFMGYNPTRRVNSPREAAIHAAWAHYFKRAAGAANGTSGPMDGLLAQILFGERGRADEVTERDWYVATTIVQWLATNVGQCILFDAGYIHEPAGVEARRAQQTELAVVEQLARWLEVTEIPLEDRVDAIRSGAWRTKEGA